MCIQVESIEQTLAFRREYETTTGPWSAKAYRANRALRGAMRQQPPASGRKDYGFPVRDLVKVVTYVRRRPQKIVHPTPSEVAHAQMFAVELADLASQIAGVSINMAASLAPAIEPTRNAAV